MLERGVRVEVGKEEGGAKGGGKEETSFSLAGLITPSIKSIYLWWSCLVPSPNSAIVTHRYQDMS